MEVQAVAKFVRVQPRKVRQVASEVRGKNAVQASQLLRFHPSKGAFVLRKVLNSAVANAAENHGLDADSLRIAEIRVDEGPKIKRIQARAMGRANRIMKKLSHITVVVEDAEVAAPKQAGGTKPKARPTFDSGKGKKKAKADKPQAAEVVEEVTEEVVEAAADVVEEPVVEAATEETATEEAATEEVATEEANDESAEESGEEKN